MLGSPTSTSVHCTRWGERGWCMPPLPILSWVDQVCEACLAEKHRRTSFPHQALPQATEPLEIVHGDLCGPITLVTLSGNHYFLMLIDDFSRLLLTTKDGAHQKSRMSKQWLNTRVASNSTPSVLIAGVSSR
jgi:hypothetical protein